MYILKRNIILYNKYNFFYKYIVNYNVPISVKDLKVNGVDIKKTKPRLSERLYGRLLKRLLYKVFDGEIKNSKDELTKEIKNYDTNN